MNTDYLLGSYDYPLDPGCIANSPARQRQDSRLMVVNRSSGEIDHTYFSNIIHWLKSGDVLVRNNTRVFPARLFGHKSTGAKLEFLLLERRSQTQWLVLCRPAKRIKLGDRIFFDELLTAQVVEVLPEGQRVLQFIFQGEFWSLLDQIGQVPIPPYIDPQLDGMGEEELKQRYQTVFAQITGSVAAPTAGLHFTPDLFAELSLRGVNLVDVTLHVGLGTFSTVKTDSILEHQMHEEFFILTKTAYDQITLARREGRRIISVGTTSMRVLESIAGRDIHFDGQGEYHGRTSIFIYPGYQFQWVDGLITNFHLPKSTLLMLVSAFYDRENLLELYRDAQQRHYRFFSFGDAMFIQ